MAVRHRIPTIFSIYMVDVLCCALGCVILLWQVNFQEAEKQTAAANANHLESEARNENLKKTLEQYKNANTLIGELTEKNRITTDRLEEAKKAYALSLAIAEKLKINLKDVEAKSDATAAELAEKAKANIDLLLKLAESEKLRTLLTADLGESNKNKTLLLSKIDELDKSKTALTAELAKALADLKVSGKSLDERVARLAELERLALALGKEKLEMLAKLKTADLRVQILENSQLEADKKFAVTAKDLETLRVAISKLTEENLEAIRKAKAIQAAAENRFAGITLTGRKIVFLVDMSGSMELSDENTADPDKWPIVCETVGRILTSLLDCTHFQVILFNDTVSFPLGKKGEWIEVKDRAADAKRVVDDMKKIRPKGPTNMYAAFDEAFRYRTMGLDTIYVMSDGLPNAGPGRPPEATTETAITQALAKHLRAKLKTDWNRTLPTVPRVKVNTVGFFYESPEVGAFLWALSRENDGSFVGLR